DRPSLLGGDLRVAAASRPDRLAGPRRLRAQCDRRRLDPRHRARTRAAPALHAVRGARTPARRPERPRRPADRRRRDVGTGVDHAHDRVRRLLLPLARPGAGVAPPPRRRRSPGASDLGAANEPPRISFPRRRDPQLGPADRAAPGDRPLLGAAPAPARGRRPHGKGRVRSTPFRRAALLGLAAAAGIASGFAFHRLHASSGRPAAAALPAFHGQASWAAGRRAAPAIALRDQAGREVRLSALRGRPVLLTFMDSQCKAECPIQGRQLGAVLRGLPPADRPTLVVVGVNPTGDTPPSIRHAMRKWTLAGPWRWHWLRGTRAQLERVWHAYGVTV